jgi:hypothetical protein
MSCSPVQKGRHHQCPLQKGRHHQCHLHCYITSQTRIFSNSSRHSDPVAEPTATTPPSDRVVEPKARPPLPRHHPSNRVAEPIPPMPVRTPPLPELVKLAAPPPPAPPPPSPKHSPAAAASAPVAPAATAASAASASATSGSAAPVASAAAPQRRWNQFQPHVVCMSDVRASEAAGCGSANDELNALIEAAGARQLQMEADPRAAASAPLALESTHCVFEAALAPASTATQSPAPPPPAPPPLGSTTLVLEAAPSTNTGNIGGGNNTRAEAGVVASSGGINARGEDAAVVSGPDANAGPASACSDDQDLLAEWL